MQQPTDTTDTKSLKEFTPEGMLHTALGLLC